MNEENNNSQQPQDENQEQQEQAAKEIKRKKVKVKTKKKKKKGIHIGIGSLVLTIFCVFLLITVTFLQLDITHFIIPAKLFQGKPCTIEDYLFTIKYIPQIPIVIFVAALLGRKFGLVSIILYIITGLFILPVFALGGGWRYIFEYGFGYIFAYIPAAFILTTILKKGFTFKNILKAVVLSVLTIHVIGVIYMMCLAGFKHAGWDFIGTWIAAQSGIKILYDIVFGYLLVLFAKYARIILWFYL
ncbi:biotin transporter BioY [bacterium]|nr:biotin transporter BioY [bacterium]